MSKPKNIVDRFTLNNKLIASIRVSVIVYFVFRMIKRSLFTIRTLEILEVFSRSIVFIIFCVYFYFLIVEGLSELRDKQSRSSIGFKKYNLVFQSILFVFSIVLHINSILHKTYNIYVLILILIIDLFLLTLVIVDFKKLKNIK